MLSASPIGMNLQGCHGTIFGIKFCLVYKIFQVLLSLKLTKTPFETLHLHELCLVVVVLWNFLFSCLENSWNFFKFVFVKTCTCYFQVYVGLGGVRTALPEYSSISKMKLELFLDFVRFLKFCTMAGGVVMYYVCLCYKFKFSKILCY